MVDRRGKRRERGGKRVRDKERGERGMEREGGRVNEIICAERYESAPG